MDNPIIYVIAGPDGIGKTTADFDFVPRGTPVINTDDIAAEIKKSGLPADHTQEFANKEAVRIMNTYLQKKLSFGIETNLADVDTWKSLLEIQKSGYRLKIIFMSTGDLELLNARVDDRVKLGGHFVSPEIVRERYLAGLNLLNHYYDKPDRLQLYDNSTTLKLVAEIKRGQLIHAVKPIPEWVSPILALALPIEVKQ